MATNTTILAIFSETDYPAEFESARSLTNNMIVFNGFSRFQEAKHVFAEKSFDMAVIYSNSLSQVDQTGFNAVSKLLKSGACLRLTTNETLAEEVHKRVKLAGLSALEVTSPGVYKCDKKVFKVKENTNLPESPAVNPFKNSESFKTGKKIVEEDLLKNDEVKTSEIGGDCSTKPKACKNCSCGRKQLE